VHAIRSPDPSLSLVLKESLKLVTKTELRVSQRERKAGERVRLAYEKKCALLRSQDASGAEPFAIDKTRAAVRDLRTKLDISLTSVDAVSRRIAAVRDDELLPQLLQLVRGYVLLLPRFEPRNSTATRTNYCNTFVIFVAPSGWRGCGE
jgi:hypothetical protein